MKFIFFLITLLQELLQKCSSNWKCFLKNIHSLKQTWPIFGQNFVLYKIRKYRHDYFSGPQEGLLFFFIKKLILIRIFLRLLKKTLKNPTISQFLIKTVRIFSFFIKSAIIWLAGIWQLLAGGPWNFFSKRINTLDKELLENCS